MEWVVAKCGNCGAALRVDPGAAQATCEYCHVTVFVRDAPPDAPRVTIAPAPEPLDETRLTAGVGIVSAAGAVVGVVLTALGYWGGIVLTALGLPLAIIVAIAYPKNKRHLMQLRLLRDRGLPGRATVRALGAGHGRAANLTLDVELGKVTRTLTHSTEIPLLLIPSVTAGCTLPVLVHPEDPDWIEVQWHLL